MELRRQNGGSWSTRVRFSSWRRVANPPSVGANWRCGATPRRSRLPSGTCICRAKVPLGKRDLLAVLFGFFRHPEGHGRIACGVFPLGDWLSFALRRNLGVLPMSTVADHSSGFSLGAAYPPLPVCRFTVEVYEEMIRAGIITEDDPIELLDGWITPKMTKNAPHLAATVAVNQTLVRAVPRGWCVVPEHPIRLAASMPEPDMMVVRGDAHSYIDRLPRAEDVALGGGDLRYEPFARSGARRSPSTPTPASLATGW